MPSPFPGMDPYLEDPALWPDVHSRLINTSSEFLLRQLRPRYVVQIDERVYLSDQNDEAHGLIVPDLHIREVPGSAGTLTAAAPTSSGIELAYGWEIEVHEAYLRILDRDSKQVITIIEFLSPANKVKGSVARRSYDDKRDDVMSTRTNMVEIDLLRQGTPLAASARIPPHDYMAQVWRWVGEKRRRRVWPMTLPNRLEIIPIPLRPSDPDASLDLQAVLNTAYDRAGYDLTIDYAKEPNPPLSGVTIEWANRTAGRRG